MRVTKKEKNGITIVNVNGRLETGSAAFFTSEINRVIAESHDIILDFEQLEYVSSAGLQAILLALQSCKVKNAKMRIINANEVVKEVFESTGFNKIVEVK